MTLFTFLIVCLGRMFGAATTTVVALFFCRVTDGSLITALALCVGAFVFLASVKTLSKELR